jgi:hypothetical protein
MKNHENEVLSDLIKKEIKSHDLLMTIYAWVVLPLAVAFVVAIVAFS